MYSHDIVHNYVITMFVCTLSFCIIPAYVCSHLSSTLHHQFDHDIDGKKSTFLHTTIYTLCKTKQGFFNLNNGEKKTISGRNNVRTRFPDPFLERAKQVRAEDS